MKIPQAHEEKLKAAVELVRRTGADSFQLRFSDDENPVVWFAVASFGDRHDAAAAIEPLRAVLRLCEQLIDGGICLHCNRPTSVEPDLIHTMPFNKSICWYQYDPEMKTFRRSCE